MKHIALREHFIRTCVNRGLINVIRISGKENTADILTKALGRVLHENGILLLGLDRGQGGVLTSDRLAKAS